MNRVRFGNLMTYCSVQSHVAEFESSECGEKFSATAYCLLDGSSYDEQCSLFIDKLSLFTSTNWIALKKIDNCVRYAFRKTYSCQLSRKNKKTYSKNNVSKNRDKECSARVDFKWKHINRSTVRNDPNLSTGMNCIVKIDFDHTHSLTAMDTMAFLRSSKETNARFNAYFKLGLTPADAKNYHEISLIDGVVNEDLVNLQLANAQINPSLRHVIHMNIVWRKNHQPEEFSYMKLMKLADTLEKQGTYVTVDKDTLTTAIITPLMIRVFNEFSQRKDKLTVWIENTDYYVSARYCGKRSLFLTIFFVSSKVGALPIGSALHNSDHTQTAYKLLKESLEKYTGKTFSPDVIIAGDDIVQRIAQQLVFPNASNLLSISKICQALWKWLGLAKRGSDQEVKKTIMRNFQKVIVSQTVEAATETFRSMCSSLKEYPQVVKHLEFIWFRRSEWCLSFRSTQPDSAINVQDCENSIRILKDTLLLRCKSFNPCALINVICHFLEKYNKERLEQACKDGTSLRPHYSKYIKSMPSDVVVEKVSEQEHHFKLSGNSPCTACVDIAFCDCPTGRSGRFCDHLCHLVSQISFCTKTSEITPEDRIIFSQLTSGLETNDDALFRDDIFDFEFVKAESIEMNDFNMMIPETNDEGGKDSEDDSMAVSRNHENIHDVEISSDEEIKNKEFKREEIEINDVHIVPIPNFFEEGEDLNNVSHSANILCKVENISEDQCDVASQDQDSDAADVGLVTNDLPSRPSGYTTSPGYAHGDSETFANVREKFGKIADLMTAGHMTNRQLMDFSKVLDEITTPDRAKVFCEEVTKLKKLKRLGFKLPTLSEERKRAQGKFSKWRAQKNDV